MQKVEQFLKNAGTYFIATATFYSFTAEPVTVKF